MEEIREGGKKEGKKTASPGFSSYCNSLTTDVISLLSKKIPFKSQLKTLFGQQSACHHCLSNSSKCVSQSESTLGGNHRSYLCQEISLSIQLSLPGSDFYAGEFVPSCNQVSPKQWKRQSRGHRQCMVLLNCPIPTIPTQKYQKIFQEELSFLLDNPLISHLK